MIQVTFRVEIFLGWVASAHDSLVVVLEDDHVVGYFVGRNHDKLLDEARSQFDFLDSDVIFHEDRLLYTIYYEILRQVKESNKNGSKLTMNLAQ